MRALFLLSGAAALAAGAWGLIGLIYAFDPRTAMRAAAVAEPFALGLFGAALLVASSALP